MTRHWDFFFSKKHIIARILIAMNIISLGILGVELQSCIGRLQDNTDDRRNNMALSQTGLNILLYEST